MRAPTHQGAPNGSWVDDQPPPRVVLWRRRRGRPLHVTDGQPQRPTHHRRVRYLPWRRPSSTRRSMASTPRSCGTCTRTCSAPVTRTPGCTVHPHLDSWWHPLEAARKRVILHARGRRAWLAQRRSRLRAAAGFAGRRLSERRPLDVVRVRSCARRPGRERPGAHHLSRARCLGGPCGAHARRPLWLGGVDPPLPRRRARPLAPRAGAGRAGRQVAAQCDEHRPARPALRAVLRRAGC